MRTEISSMTGATIEVPEEGIDWSPVRTPYFNCLESSGCRTKPDEPESYIHMDDGDCGICGGENCREILAVTEGRCTCWSTYSVCRDCGDSRHE